MVIAMRAVLVALFELLRVFAKTLFALFAGKSHVEGLKKRVCFMLVVALGTIEPLAAWNDLSVRLIRMLYVTFEVQHIAVQQGDRIATCALRMCLLASISR